MSESHKITIYPQDETDILRALETQCSQDLQHIQTDNIFDPIILIQERHLKEGNILDRYEQLCRIIKGEGTRRPSKSEPTLPIPNIESNTDAPPNT